MNMAMKKRLSQDSKNRVPRTEGHALEQDGQNRTARKGQQEHDRDKRTTRTEQPDQERQNNMARIGLLEQDSHERQNQDRPARTGRIVSTVRYHSGGSMKLNALILVIGLFIT